MKQVIRIGWLLMIGWLGLGQVGAQISINSQQQLITTLLQELHEVHGWSMSYDPQTLAECYIDLEQDFIHPQAALESIVAQCDLQLKMVNDVFVIVKKEAMQDTSATYYFRGIVVDQATKEPLPFATVLLNHQVLIADENGRVAAHCTQPSISLEATHLGYYSLKQVCQVEEEKLYYLALKPASTQLQEILVEGQDSSVHTTVHNGEQGVGLSQLNATRVPFLAGNTTNSLFSYLRLQAGVLAAGEPEKDVVLWGSYKGQSHLLYDGITLFSPTTYNNVLGMVNPRFVQAVELYKGGQPVDLGDRVGGVVHLHSPRGKLNENHYEIGVSNQLVDGYASIGLRQKGNLQVGIRHVLPHTFRGKLIGIPQQPFIFGDIHLKYSQHFTKGWSMKMSTLANYDLSQRTSWYVGPGLNPIELIEYRTQFFGGGSLQLYKDWKKWGQTTLRLGGSSIDFEYDLNRVESHQSQQSIFLFSTKYQKGISEGYLALKHQWPALKWHQPSLGIKGIYQKVYLQYPFPTDHLPAIRQEGKRVQGYFQDRCYVLPHLTATVGIKWTVPLWKKTALFLQPQWSITYTPHKHWKMSWAMGWYQQFLTENSIVDKNYQQAYHWNIATASTTPILQSHHQVLNLSYIQKNIQIRWNGYYKSFDNLSRYQVGANAPQYGKARSYGAEVQAAYNIPHGKFWGSYSIGRREETFDVDHAHYQSALHDQRHEIKLVGIVHWKYFTLSTNYVWGSGLLNPVTAKRDLYSRWDAALLFQYQFRALRLEAGLSMINILNTYNSPYLSYQNHSLYTPKTNLHQGITLFFRVGL